VVQLTKLPDAQIGVVAVETFAEEREWKAYMGISAGYSQGADEQFIAMMGCGLQPEVAHVLFPNLDIEKYKKY